MWKLGLSDGGVVRDTISIPDEETTFYAVLKRGPTVHNATGTFVRCDHLAKTGDKMLVFRMSLLEATTLDDFEAGIMGLWKIREVKGIVTISLVEEYTNGKTFLEDAKSDQNPDWIRSCYTCL
jgi:hypothetical protein